jgi:hypothetical protein
MISQTAASRVKVVALGLADDHGETDERPMPEPNATRSKVIATAVTAPPMIAAHEAADRDSDPETFSATTTDSVTSAIPDAPWVNAK